MKRIAYMAVGAALLVLPGEISAQATGTTPDPTAIADGARVWANNCTRCHTPRPSAERTDRQWLTIVAHMRARANLRRSDALAVATFLRATNAAQATPVTATSDATGAAEDADESSGDAGAAGEREPERPAAVSSLVDALKEADLTAAEWERVLAYLRALQAPR